MELQIHIHPLRLKHRFTISRDSQEVVETVVASLEQDGIVGYGEASPSRYYHHTPDSVAAALESARPLLEHADPLQYRHLLDALIESLQGNRAALCALDLALFDWLGKRLGQPLHSVFGLEPALAPISSFTIGISSIGHMQEKVREAEGFPIFKIKLGTGEDLSIIRALREESLAAFRVDANCAWSVEETIEKSRELAALGVEFIEQPLPPENLEAMERVYRESALPVIADENSVTPDDVSRLAGRFHGINIKLVKCGGLLPAMRMIHLARTFGLKVMIGCMIESSVGISGGAQLGPLADYLDLDGAILIDNDPFHGVENHWGRLVFAERPGLGVIPRAGR